MPLRLAGFTLTLSAGLAGVEVHVDNLPHENVPQRTLPERPSRVAELVNEVRAALLSDELDTVRQRLLVLALEFGPSVKSEVLTLAARTRSLHSARKDEAIPRDSYYRTEARPFEDLFDFLERAEPTLDDRARSEAKAGSGPSANAATAKVHSAPTNTDASGSPVLACYGVSLASETRRILQEVDLELYPSEIVAIVGRNGAGKTSLMRVLAREVSQSEGQLAYFDTAANAEVKVSRDEIAYSSQVPTPFFGTMAQTLLRYAALRGRRHSQLTTDVDYVIELLELVPYRYATWSVLSSGYRTRFELAKSLLAEPRVLLLDEPLGPLDYVSRLRYLRTLRDLARSKRQVAILISTQDVQAVEEYADRIVVLERGRVEYAGAPGHIGHEFGDALYEVRVRGTANELAASLEKIDSVCVTPQRELFRISAPLASDSSLIIDNIRRAGIELTYFRDLTNSVLRIFERTTRDR